MEKLLPCTTDCTARFPVGVLVAFSVGALVVVAVGVAVLTGAELALLAQPARPIRRTSKERGHVTESIFEFVCNSEPLGRNRDYIMCITILKMRRFMTKVACAVQVLQNVGVLSREALDRAVRSMPGRPQGDIS
jgi:hypothetical protein